MTSVNNQSLDACRINEKNAAECVGENHPQNQVKSCPNPGIGKPSSMKSMRKMQEKLNWQMGTKSKKGMKEGKGEKEKPGEDR
ncbi:MAG: hypothetical protein IPH20_21130 [Bacteroidales bacterium]|nr:hypothetical protein [Bacteroidales bacterium]